MTTKLSTLKQHKFIILQFQRSEVLKGSHWAEPRSPAPCAFLEILGENRDSYSVQLPETAHTPLPLISFHTQSSRGWKVCSLPHFVPPVTGRSAGSHLMINWKESEFGQQLRSPWLWGNHRLWGWSLGLLWLSIVLWSTQLHTGLPAFYPIPYLCVLCMLGNNIDMVGQQSSGHYIERS